MIEKSEDAGNFFPTPLLLTYRCYNWICWTCWACCDYVNFLKAQYFHFKLFVLHDNHLLAD